MNMNYLNFKPKHPLGTIFSVVFEILEGNFQVNNYKLFLNRAYLLMTSKNSWSSTHPKHYMSYFSDFSSPFWQLGLSIEL